MTASNDTTYNGYNPNMPIDGGICYRCNGTGR
jgi:hypothetical protein